DHDWWHDAARSGRDVEKSGRRDPRHEAPDPAVEKVGVEVDRQVQVTNAVEGHRKRHARDLDRLLDDVAFRDGDLDRRLPFRLVDGPAEDDTLATVLVVWLEHHGLPAPGDVGDQLGSHTTRPWDVAPDRRSLGGGVKALAAVVRQQGQAHLLVQALGAKAG